MYFKVTNCGGPVFFLEVESWFPKENFPYHTTYNSIQMRNLPHTIPYRCKICFFESYAEGVQTDKTNSSHFFKRYWKVLKKFKLTYLTENCGTVKCIIVFPRFAWNYILLTRFIGLQWMSEIDIFIPVQK